jgi:membrane protease YdiL (CAAX protease family)
MKPSDIFFNDVGRLRSGWRFVIYIALFVLLESLIEIGIRSLAPASFLESNWGFIVQSLLLLTAGLLAGWACAAGLEGLPRRSLGWAIHRGWLRDLLWGSLIGIASLLVATAMAAALGGFHFASNPAGISLAVIKTLVVSSLVFIPAAAAEEMVFRGYPLQTMTRARLAWLGLALTSILFAWVHLDNPNVVPGFTLLNTTLAGIWLGVAYLRTRSLWFPLGIHWSWNWMMGAVLGLPVSGIDRLTPEPILRATDAGPAWLTGGAYGIEGGAACTLALVLSTLFIWRTRLVAATPEMLELTDKENPKPVLSTEY